MFHITKTGREIFKDACRALTDRKIEYQVDEAKLQIYAKDIKGFDLPISVQIVVDEETTTLNFACPLAFKAPPASYSDVLIQLNTINTGIRFGAFILNPADGWLGYRYSYIYAQARPSSDMISALVGMVIKIVDEYDTPLKQIVPVNTSARDPMFG